jgi:hypothetical protein
MKKASSAEASWLGVELAHQRVDVAEVTRTLLELAGRDAAVIPPLVRQLSQAEDVPRAAYPLLIETATGKDVDAELRHQAAVALAKTDSKEAFAALLKSLHLPGKGDGPHLARKAFQEARHLENHYDLFIEEAGRDAAHARSAIEALTILAGRMFGAPEARAASEKALNELWEKGGKVQRMVVASARDTKLTTWASRIAPFLSSENKELAEAASSILKAWVWMRRRCSRRHLRISLWARWSLQRLWRLWGGSKAIRAGGSCCLRNRDAWPVTR